MIHSALTVSQLNFFIKSMFEAEPRLQRVCVKGEISNFTEHYKSGHLYFSLKDSTAAVKAVMFRSSAAKLRFKPYDGMSVVVTGRISVFERDGQYQLYCDTILPDGAGALAEAFEQLKEKLSKEGLFAADKKKPIPAFPERIGVVTAKDGAAVRDIFTVLERRWPMSEIILCPVLVQGSMAAASIADAIAKLNQFACCDVIIVGRGGGSMEDLWAFNEEITVRAVAASDIPVISAVGHETDFTLCDFAADLRAPTPSAAAELAVPDRSEVCSELNHLYKRLRRGVQDTVNSRETEVKRFREKTSMASLLSFIDGSVQYCDSLTARLQFAADRKVRESGGLLAGYVSALDALSPLKVLTRGYAICEKNGTVLDSAAKINKGDRTELVFSDGRAVCEVLDVKAETI